MTWHTGPLLAFDLETTAPDPDYARIVTATLVGLQGAEPNYDALVDPGVPIPAGAAAIHGITTEAARAAGEAPEGVVFALVGFIARALGQGTPLVGFNIAYDLTVLDRECIRHGIARLSERLDVVAPVVDAHVLDKAMDRYRRGKRTLSATCEHYGIELSEDDAHTSRADALASARLVWKIAEQYGAAADDGALFDDSNAASLPTDLMVLHERQVDWRREQAASLQAYFRRTRPDAVVNGEWPIQSVSPGWDPTAHPVDEGAAA